MPHTETNIKHAETVKQLLQHLKVTGRYVDLSVKTKAGYDIVGKDKESNKTVYFAVMLFSDRLYDAITLEEWQVAISSKREGNKYYFVAAVGKSPYSFYYYTPSMFMNYCSIPKFKISCNLQKRDLGEKRYLDINDIISGDIAVVETTRPRRRVSKELSEKRLHCLSDFWKEL